MTRPRNAPASAAQPVVAHRMLHAVLHSPLGLLLDGLGELQFVGRVSGRAISLPVQCADDETRLVVYVGHAAGKTWWRNFTERRPVQVHIRGRTLEGLGRVIDSGHPDRPAIDQLYGRRYPKVTVAPADPMIVIELTRGRAEG